MSNANTAAAESTATVTKTGGVTLYRNLKERDGRHMGRAYVGTTHVGQHADVKPGKSVRLHGVDANYRKPARPHDVTFEVGEMAVFDSYNLVFTGKITKITANTVTVLGHSDQPKRMTMAEFGRRNAHYDAEAIAKRNGDWLD